MEPLIINSKMFNDFLYQVLAEILTVYEYKNDYSEEEFCVTTRENLLTKINKMNKDFVFATNFTHFYKKLDENEQEFFSKAVYQYAYENEINSKLEQAFKNAIFMLLITMLEDEGLELEGLALE